MSKPIRAGAGLDDAVRRAVLGARAPIGTTQHFLRWTRPENLEVFFTFLDQGAGKNDTQRLLKIALAARE